MTDDELIAKAEKELASLTMCMSPDEVAKLEAHRLIALARIGASVMPRAIEEAAVNEHIIRFRNAAFQGCDYWYDLWKQNYQQWPDPPTHFIPLSALPKPAEVTT